MIENTLMTRSSRAMAVASGSGTPYATWSTPTTPASTMPEPGRAEGHGGEQRADEGDEDRARQAEGDIVEAERLDHEEQAQSLGHPDQTGQQAELRQVARHERTEDALLEPVVQLEDLMRQRAARR